MNGIVALQQAQASARKTFAYPIIDSGSGYAARPATSLVSAGLALYQGPSQPSDWVAGDRWTPTYTTARQVIIDTDWYTDVDDVVAMRVAAYYEKIGLIDIAACIVDTTAPTGAPSLDAFWRSEGRVMQIGQLPGANSDLASGGSYQTTLLAGTAHYGASDASVFPDSTTVYRTALAAAANGSVDIISIGYLNALQSLLLSAADGISGLTGAQLVAAKVRHLWVMGGTYPTGTENNFSRSTKAIAAANYVVANWPAPTGWTTAAAPYVTFSGFEVGQTILTGDTLQNLAASTDQLYAALVAYGAGATGRSSWDPLNVQLAALGGAAAAGYTTVRGTNAVNASTGANTFTTGATGPHEYTVKSSSDATFKASINALLVPGRQPEPLTGTQVLRSDGIVMPASWKDRQRGRFSPIITGSTDLGALAAFKASDYAGADGDAISSISGANSFPAWTQAAGTNQPTYRAAVGSRACLQFGGSHWLETPAVAQSAQLTVYARVRWAVLPTSNQSIVADDGGGTSGTVPDKSMHLKGITGSIAQAVGFVNSSGTAAGFTDNEAGLVANTWHLLVLKRTLTTVECFVDGATDGATAPAGGGTPLYANLPLHLGCSKHSGTTATEGLVGYVAEVRVYAGAHTTGQIATISATM